MSSTNEIRQQKLIKAPPSRVWRAITDAAEFGAWFRVKLESPFVAGQETSVGSLLGRLFPESGNIALLQRPVHPIGLASAVKVALAR